jgi:hypothetical protein
LLKAHNWRQAQATDPALWVAPSSVIGIIGQGRRGQAEDPVKAPGERDRIKEKEREQAQIGQQGSGE